MGQDVRDEWAGPPAPRGEAPAPALADLSAPGGEGDAAGATNAPSQPSEPTVVRAVQPMPPAHLARRFGKVLRKSNGFSLVEVLVGDGASPIGFCVLGPGSGLAATWLLGLPEAEVAFTVRVSAEARNPQRRRPIRRHPREE